MRPPPVDALQDMSELEKALQKAEYRAALAEQIAVKQQQPPSEEISAADDFRKVVAPSPEDLFGLLKLCGSEDGVIAYLAKHWSMSTTAIGPTVRGWIKALPDVPPPSRQRSAPPVISPAVSAFALANATAGQHAKRPPQVMQIREPPPSAPVPTSAPNLVAAMRALDARLSA